VCMCVCVRVCVWGGQSYHDHNPTLDFVIIGGSKFGEGVCRAPSARTGGLAA